MDQEELQFNIIAEKLKSENNSISLGKMMSTPGIIYKNKVFAFYYNKEMVFRLGKGFDLSPFEIENFSFLNPFRNKPPMTGWFQITFADHEKWEELARVAMQNLAKELDK